ncbi:MAG: dihydroorotate dehydrogenase electron transfer subunit [bacterium]
MKKSIVQQIVHVSGTEVLTEGISLIRFRSKEISSVAEPGQFVNIRTADLCMPLLRRPFSISRIDGDQVELLFAVIGMGTKILASKSIGDELDVLGPLGQSFHMDGDFSEAIIVAGGLGVAPFPFLTMKLREREKTIISLIGARTREFILTQHLDNVQTATDDGSIGFHGNVVQLLKQVLSENNFRHPKVFTCGPSRMMQALAEYANSIELECEVSLEGEMACGIGICQGCPVERVDGKKKYSLVCTEGPTFSSKEIIIRS